MKANAAFLSAGWANLGRVIEAHQRCLPGSTRRSATIEFSLAFSRPGSARASKPCHVSDN
jgi:hypothetical protein